MNDWPDHLRHRLSSWSEQGLRRELKVAAGCGVRFKWQEKEILSFATNDYLGLAAHPAVIAAAQAAAGDFGAGATASPLICGHRTPHAVLEARLAKFKQAPAALIFPSGYQAALATLTALADAEDTIILDKLAHASLLDGAALSGARVRVFKHNNLEDLASLLDREKDRRCIVAAESLYSMDGDVAPVAELAELAGKHGALVLVDEAHATGVLGNTGRGLLETLGPLPPHVIALGTLSKALGAQGGYVCAAQEVLDTVVHAGRAYLFSTALAPTSAAAANAALDVIDREPQRREHLSNLSKSMRETLASNPAFRIPHAALPTPIIPLIVGDERRATDYAAKLLGAGLLVPAVRYPTVKKGEARLRISLSAAHTPDDVALLLRHLKAIC